MTLWQNRVWWPTENYIKRRSMNLAMLKYFDVAVGDGGLTLALAQGELEVSDVISKLSRKTSEIIRKGGAPWAGRRSGLDAAKCELCGPHDKR